MPSTTSSSIIRGGGGVLLSLRAPRSLPGHAEGRKTATAAEDTTKRERERERERRNKRERRPSRERLEAAARCRQAARVFGTSIPRMIQEMRLIGKIEASLFGAGNCRPSLEIVVVVLY